MRKVLAIIGGILGLLFSILDSVVNYSDTALLDEYGMSIISWQFFIEKMVVYIIIGGIRMVHRFKLIN
jgi:hypothetical protein